LFTQGDRLVVGTVLGTEPLGIYAAMANIASQINTFSALMVQPILPALTTTAEAEPRRQQALKALQLNAAVALGLGAILFALAPWVITFMIPGADTLRDVPLLRVMVVIYSLYSICAVGYYVLFGLEDVWANTLTVLAFGSLSLLAITLGAWSYGLWGAVLGNMGYLGNLLLNQLGLGRLGLPLRTWGGSLVPSLLVFGLGLGLVLILPPWLAPAVVLLQGLIVGGWLIRLRGVNVT